MSGASWRADGLKDALRIARLVITSAPLTQRHLFLQCFGVASKVVAEFNEARERKMWLYRGARLAAKKENESCPSSAYGGSTTLRFF